MQTKIFSSLVTLVALFFFSSCQPGSHLEGYRVKTPRFRPEIEQNIIIDYAVENRLNMEKTDSGIFYMFKKKGEGTTNPSARSRVTVLYTVKALESGDIIEKVDEEPVEFDMSEVIEGWREAMTLMTEGAKAVFIIPSHLAYADNGNGEMVDAGEILMFDIELIDVLDVVQN